MKSQEEMMNRIVRLEQS
jgi:hypothetical protein